jgi:hypothetical protein
MRKMLLIGALIFGLTVPGWLYIARQQSSHGAAQIKDGPVLGDVGWIKDPASVSSMLL